MQSDLLDIFGDVDGLDKFAETQPIIYSENGKPYGAIKIMNYRDGVAVLSATKDNQPFLMDMILFIRKVAKVCKVYILHSKDSLDISINIRRAFGKRFRSKTLVTKDLVITIVRYKHGYS